MDTVSGEMMHHCSEFIFWNILCIYASVSLYDGVYVNTVNKQKHTAKRVIYLFIFFILLISKFVVFFYSHIIVLNIRTNARSILYAS